MSTQEQNDQVEKLKDLATVLVKQAGQIQLKINESKTSAKRDYYNKKMAKARTDIKQVLATIELYNITMERADEQPSTSGT